MVQVHKAEVYHIGSIAWDGGKALPRTFSGSMPHQKEAKNARITHGILHTNFTKKKKKCIFKPPFPTDIGITGSVLVLNLMKPKFGGSEL